MQSIEWKKWILRCKDDNKMTQQEIISLLRQYIDVYKLEWIKNTKEAARKFVERVIKHRQDASKACYNEVNMRMNAHIKYRLNSNWNDTQIAKDIKKYFNKHTDSTISSLKRRVKRMRDKLTQNMNINMDIDVSTNTNATNSMNGGTNSMDSSLDDNNSMNDREIVYDQPIGPINVYDIGVNSIDIDMDTEEKDEDKSQFKNLDHSHFIKSIYDSDDSDIEYDCGAIALPKLSKRCGECGQEIASHTWSCGCYKPGCNRIYHRCCVLPDLVDKKKMYCRQHFEEKYLWNVPYNTEKSDLYLLRVLSTDCLKYYYYVYREKRQFRSYIRTSNDVLNGNLTYLETVLQEGWNVRLYDWYRISPEGTDKIFIDEFIDCDTINHKSDPIIIQHYKMGPTDSIPIGTTKLRTDSYTQGMFEELGLDMWENWEWWCYKYGDSIQGGGGPKMGNRMKVHGNKFYATTGNKNEKTLHPCSLTFKKLFRTRKQRKAVRVFLRNLYFIGLVCGLEHDDVKFLLHPKEVVFLTTIYNGVGIKPHVDKNFWGIVFCYVSFIKKVRGAAELDENALFGKCISWGICGSKIIIEGAEIKNEVGQLYWFYGYFTDFGVHGVPTMPGYLTIIHIFRQARPLSLRF